MLPVILLGACGGMPEEEPQEAVGESSQAVMYAPPAPASGNILHSTTYLGPVAAENGEVQTYFTTNPQYYSFTVSVRPGAQLGLEVTHLGSSMYLDTGLLVYGPKNASGSYGTAVLAQDDDSGYGTLSRIYSVNLAQGGEYLVVVSSGTGSGKQFRLQVDCLNGFCAAGGPLPLTNGVPISVSGTTGSMQSYFLNVPSTASNVIFETSGGTGDVDLYVRQGTAPDLSTYDCRPFLGGNFEGCNMASPTPGYWVVMLHSFASYSGVTLKGIVANRLVDGAVSTSASAPQGSSRLWTIDVPEGMSTLKVTMAGLSGATGDADLYVRYGMAPTSTLFDCRPYIGGNSEVCTINAPQAGTWYVMTHGWSAYSGVTVTADHF